MCLPWEHPLFRAVSGGEWHPGGAAATERLWRACRAALIACAGSGTREARDVGRPLRLLDAGCGEGATARRLAAEGQSVVALDRTPQPVWSGGSFSGECTAWPLFCAADVCRIPLRDDWADVMLCQCVASLLPCPAHFFAEAARVLRPGGVLGFSDLLRRGGRPGPAAGEGSACAKDDTGGGVPTVAVGGCVAGARRGEEWEALLRAAGFRVVSFADESRELARLAAQLVWYGDGESLRRFGLDGAAGCRGGCRGGGRPGYGAWVAVNTGQGM